MVVGGGRGERVVGQSLWHCLETSGLSCQAQNGDGSSVPFLCWQDMVQNCSSSVLHGASHCRYTNKPRGWLYLMNWDQGTSMHYTSTTNMCIYWLPNKDASVQRHYNLTIATTVYLSPPPSHSSHNNTSYALFLVLQNHVTKLMLRWRKVLQGV